MRYLAANLVEGEKLNSESEEKGKPKKESKNK
jgi:hypothetical protein